MEDYAKYTTAGRSLEIVALNKGGEKERYKSTFLQTGEGSYLISAPKFQDKTATLRPGQDVSVYLYTPEGIYNLKCEVLGTRENVYEISFAKSIQRAQRREYVRVNLRIGMRATLGSGQTVDVTTNNVSARGCSFYSKINIGINEKVSLQFKMGGKTVQTFANVVSSKPKLFTSGAKYLIALNFTSVTEADIDLIIKECFAHQARQRLAVLNSAYDIEDEG